MDGFSFRSYEKAWKAIEQGKFKKEIVPFTFPPKGASQRSLTRMKFLSDSQNKPRGSGKTGSCFQERGCGHCQATPLKSATAHPPWWSCPGKSEAARMQTMVRVGLRVPRAIDMKYVLAAPIYSIPRCSPKRRQDRGRGSSRDQRGVQLFFRGDQQGAEH